MTDVFSELDDIGRMLDSASVLIAVRQEVSKVMKSGFVVTDGRHYKGSDCEVVVRCGENEGKVARRLQDKMPQMDISKIAEGVLGLRYSRRSRPRG